MINIIVAFKEEARPFIDLLSLKPQPRVGAFAGYRRGDVRLLVSGMGAENAAAATRFLWGQFAGTSSEVAATRWLNFGIAGSGQFAAGAVVAASRVRRQSSGEQWRCRRPPSIRLPDALVRTVERPESGYGECGVYDLEAAGICHALRAAGCAAEITCVKLVTDGPAQPVSRLKRKTIRRMLGSVAPQLSSVLEGMRGNR